jgi:hypothetical protein
VTSLEQLIRESETDSMAIRLVGENVCDQAGVCLEENHGQLLLVRVSSRIYVDSTAVLVRNRLCDRCDSIYNDRGLAASASSQQAALAFLGFASQVDLFDRLSSLLCDVPYAELDTTSRCGSDAKEVCGRVWSKIREMGSHVWTEDRLEKAALNMLANTAVTKTTERARYGNGFQERSSDALTPSDDGYAWKSANGAQRREFCRELWRRTGLHDATYYYEVLSEFYDTSDPNILSTEISWALGLAEALQ